LVPKQKNKIGKRVDAWGRRSSRDASQLSLGGVKVLAGIVKESWKPKAADVALVAASSVLWLGLGAASVAKKL